MMKKGILTLLVVTMTVMVASTVLAGGTKVAPAKPSSGQSGQGYVAGDGVL